MSAPRPDHLGAAHTEHPVAARTVLAWGLGGLTLALALVGVTLAWMTRGTSLPTGMDRVGIAYFASWVVFAGVGVLLAVRRPTNAVGWSLLAAGITWTLSGLSGVYRVAALLERPELPGGVVAAWLWDTTWPVGVVAVFLVALLFPDGRLPSRRWRPVIGLLVIGAVSMAASIALRPWPLPSTPLVDNPAGVEGLGGLLEGVEVISGVAMFVGIVSALAAPLVRYRRGGTVERQQLKWFAYAGVIVLLAWLVAHGLQTAGADPALLGNLRLVPLLLLPLAIAFAVLQHRLYDIDVVINRSLVYGALAAFIGVVYVVVVVGVGGVIGRRGVADVPLTITATALTAVAFAPLRARLQALANRLVYGPRASPYEALASFTSRMSDVASADAALGEVARTVAEAVGAEAAQVWVRAGGHLHRSACWPPAVPAPSATAGYAPAEPDGPDGTVAVPDNGDGSLTLPGADRTYPVRRRGRLLGALAVTAERITPAEDALLTDLASAAWLLLDNVALIDELRASRQRLVSAQDAERARIERDLHDGAQQRLLELALTLRSARDEAAQQGAEDAAATVDAAQTQLRAALSELREFARGIHPTILTTQGLGQALESLAERASLPVTVEQHVTGRLPPTVEATAYFVASEALANVTKHAHASKAAVTAVLADGRLRLTVSDDGVGGAETRPAGLGGAGTGSSGLQGLADRVAALDGCLRVTSPRGAGTRVEVELPCG